MKKIKKKSSERKKIDNIMFNGNNTINTSKKQKKNWDYDISKIKYDNCNKKYHIINIYTKPKNEYQFQQFLYSQLLIIKKLYFKEYSVSII